MMSGFGEAAWAVGIPSTMRITIKCKRRAMATTLVGRTDEMKLEPWRAINMLALRMTFNLKQELASNGFAIVEDVLTDSLVKKLIEEIERAFVRRGNHKGYGLRQLTKAVPEVLEIAQSQALRDLVEPVLGTKAFVIQSLFFDKTPDANWNVAWHQDLMIPVESKVDDPQYGPWSLKDEVWHVQPPPAMLEGILTVRLHLDDCLEGNGPLRVLPGSHTAGILTAEKIDKWRRARVRWRAPSKAAVLC